MAILRPGREGFHPHGLGPQREVDDRLRRRLFVGMTRAQWRLECVMSPRAEIALVQILEA